MCNVLKMAGDVASGSLLSSLSGLLGTSEPALRLLLSIFLGYPLALFHRKYLYGQKGLTQHLFFLISGISIGFFNYGYDMLHPLSAILYTYLITTLLNGSLLSLQISFALNFGHLLFGYYLTSTDDYDIKWTMPHCVLVLRLIGYSFNVYDGTQPDASLSSENKLVCVKTRPNFIEYCGFMCFPASFLVGPQFPYKRYENFCNGLFKDPSKEDGKPDCVIPGLKRLGHGILYLTMFQVGSSFFTDTYTLTDDFAQLNFIKRLFYIAFWARFQLYKYISCWLLTEGALIMFSLSFNGKDKNNESLWDGCENVKLMVFENTKEFNHYIQSFNINTNHWVAQYVYKRLKFLNNRYISQFAALMFLAVWHGFHSGYYMCFFMEFLVMFFEKDLKSILGKNEKIMSFLNQGPVQFAMEIILRLYTFIFMGWCLIPFVLLKFPKYWQVYGSMNYIGFILFLMWPIAYKPLLKAFLGSNKSARDNKATVGTSTSNSTHMNPSTSIKSTQQVKVD